MMRALTAPGMFRLILATMVLVQHLSRFRIGNVAVMVFFMLSGYWVMRMFDQTYRHMPRPLTTFYVSRFLRVWLLFVTVLILAIVLLGTVFGRYDPATWAGLPILGIATHGKDALGISWSLDIELQFYLLLPLMWLVTDRLRSAADWAGFAAAVILLFAVGWALKFGIGLALVLAYLPLFAAGAAIHMLQIRAPGWLGALSAGLFVLAGVALYQSPDLRPWVSYGVGVDEYDTLFAIAWALLLLPFVAWNVHQPGGPVDRHLGNLSYALYLVHYPMILAGRELVGRDLSDPEKLVVLVGAPVLALALYLLVDRRYERLRRRVVRALKTLPPPRRAAIIPIESAPMRESDSVQ